MRLAVPAEPSPQETRVSLPPDGVAALVKDGWEVTVQAGAGAHGKLTTPQGIVRRQKPRSPAHYMTRVNERGWPEQALTAADLDFEFMLNALRLARGFPLDLYTERTGQLFDAAGATCQAAITRGLLEIDDGWCRPTAMGRRFLDDLQAMFLPASATPGIADDGSTRDCA